MKLTTAQTAQNIAGFIVFGNGKHDKERITAPIAEKLNHHKTILAPQKTSALGLRKSIETAAELINRFAKDTIIIIDREHLKNQNIHNILKEYFPQIKIITQTNNLLQLQVTRGPKTAKLHIAIMGNHQTPKIEANIATLIKQTLNINIQPQKNTIKQTLRKHNLTIQDLIKTTNINKLEKAFQNIITALKNLNNPPSQK